MTNAVTVKSYSQLFNAALKNVKGCFFQCLSAFFPLIVTVILVDVFFWDNKQSMAYFQNKPDIVFRLVDDGLNIVLLVLVLYGWLTALKTLRLSETELADAASCQASKVIVKRAGSLFGTGLMVLAKSLLWGVLLVIPGIIYYFLCGYALVINVVEEKNMKESIEQSIILIKNHWSYYLGGYVFAVVMWIMMVYPVWFLLHTCGLLMSQRGYFLVYNTYQYLALLWACGAGVLTTEFHYQIYKKLTFQDWKKDES